MTFLTGTGYSSRNLLLGDTSSLDYAMVAGAACYYGKDVTDTVRVQELTPEVLGFDSQSRRAFGREVGMGKFLLESGELIDTVTMNVWDYTIQPADTSVAVGAAFPYRFVMNPSGTPCTYSPDFQCMLIYSSSDTSVVKVSVTGDLTAVGPGDATISAVLTDHHAAPEYPPRSAVVHVTD